ncbi:hypothetical protein LRY29_00100 [Candidatus Saccharibacteria bacterium]|nr:hypothetical protein [Candidatus Saccharibacteria bacterium]
MKQPEWALRRLVQMAQRALELALRALIRAPQSPALQLDQPEGLILLAQVASPV